MKTEGIRDLALDVFKDTSIFEESCKQFESYNPKEWGLAPQIYQNICNYIRALSKANDALMDLSQYIKTSPKEKMNSGIDYKLEEKCENLKQHIEKNVVFWSCKFEKYVSEDITQLLDSTSEPRNITKAKILLNLTKELTKTMQDYIQFEYNNLNDKMSTLENELQNFSLKDILQKNQNLNKVTPSASGVDMYR